MRIRTVASRLAAFAFPLAAIAGGIPAINGAVRAANRPAANRPAAEPPAPEVRLSDPAPEPAREDPFDITLPPGWKGGEVFDGGYDAERTWRYEDGDGNFFVVNIDPAGTDFDTDRIWYYAVADGGFVLDNVHRCTPGEPMCGAGDGRLDIFGLSVTGEGSARVGDHAWYFHFGNTRTEDATAPWQDLLESVRPR